MTKQFISRLEDCLIDNEATIREAMVAISRGGALMACLVDESRKLLGIVTDADVRRSLLQGYTLESPARDAASLSPVTGGVSWSSQDLIAIANSEGVREIPLLDDLGRVCDIFVLMTHQERHDFQKEVSDTKPVLDCSMLIIAGGRGTRLRSVVSDRPKPLALVGDKPIIQTLIEHARRCGIRNIIVSVKYLANQIINHLASDIYKDLSIRHLMEDDFLGTAGCLSLLGDEWKNPLLVTNGDVLTNAPFDLILRHHERSQADITCVVRPFSLVVPYGVVNMTQEQITGVHEKPTHEHIVNAGIYVLSPCIKEHLRPGEVLDMPQLIAMAIAAGRKVSPFYIHEYWLDIGKPEDYARANADFANNLSELVGYQNET